MWLLKFLVTSNQISIQWRFMLIFHKRFGLWSSLKLFVFQEAVIDKIWVNSLYEWSIILRILFFAFYFEIIWRFSGYYVVSDILSTLRTLYLSDQLILYRNLLYSCTLQKAIDYGSILMIPFLLLWRIILPNTWFPCYLRRSWFLMSWLSFIQFLDLRCHIFDFDQNPIPVLLFCWTSYTLLLFMWIRIEFWLMRNIGFFAKKMTNFVVHSCFYL